MLSLSRNNAARRLLNLIDGVPIYGRVKDKLGVLLEKSVGDCNLKIFQLHLG